MLKSAMTSSPRKMDDAVDVMSCLIWSIEHHNYTLLSSRVEYLKDKFLK